MGLRWGGDPVSGSERALRRGVLGLLAGVVIAVAGCASADRPTAPAATVDTLPTLPAPLVVRRWSDPAAWPGGRVPVADDLVTVPAGTLMQLDISPPPLAGLDIQGELEADTARDLTVTVGWIRVAGALRIGSEAIPYTKRALITLTGTGSGDAITGMGTRVIGVVPGGRLSIHGQTRRAWTRLSGTVGTGMTTITVSDEVDWRVGDRIVIAPSGFDPLQAEHRRINAIAGRTLTLDQALRFPHYGEIQQIAGRPVDERAEVGLLSRNITIQGAGPLVDGVPTTTDGLGGHIMILAGATAKVHGVELVNMGQRGRLGHYPIHWHLAGAVSGQFIRNSAIWRSNNRCVTVHGTQQLSVEGNVCYDHLGHGYFLEEGAETGNRLFGNLGLLSRRPEMPHRLIPSDERPATFWVTNPDNSLVANAAAGSEGIGFWYALPDAPIGMSTGQPHRPNRTPLWEFHGNTAHSNHQAGLFVDDAPRANGTTTATSYVPSLIPGQAGSPIVPARFTGFTAYKNGNRGVWLRGNQHFLEDAILADNYIGATFASVESYITGSLVVGATANTIGTRDVYRGFEYYDGPVGARDVTFVGFRGSGSIPWSALGFNRHNAFSLSTASASQNLTFVQSNPLYIEQPSPTKDGDKSAVFQDVTGSVTGTAGRWVTANTPFLTTADCVLQRDWNASVCPGPYLKLVVEGVGSQVNIVPVDVVRDDAASERFVGDGTSTNRIAMSAMPGHEYALTLGQRPMGVSIRVMEGRLGDSILLSIASSSPPITVGSNTARLTEVAHPSAVAQGNGTTYAYDPVQGRIYVKIVVTNVAQYVQGTVGIQLTP